MGKRRVNIGLRTLHLVGLVGVGGGVLFGAPLQAWLLYLVSTVSSGIGLVLLDLWTSWIWLVQVRGLGVLAKLATLACLGGASGYDTLILLLTATISGVVAHAPARARYFSILHGRQVDTWETR